MEEVEKKVRASYSEAFVKSIGSEEALVPSEMMEE